MERFYDTEKAKILVVEDKPEYQMIIKSSLGVSDSHIYVSSLEEARSVLPNFGWDLILLNVQIQDGNGLDFCVELSRLYNESKISFAPILILSEIKDIGDRIKQFDIGSLDVIEKPFQPLELRSRAKHKIEFFKRAMLQQNNQVFVGNLQLDKIKRKVFLGDNGEQEEVSLSRKEFDIIVFFVENKEAVLSRELLLSSIWGEGTYVLDRSVDSVISEIRKKIKNWNHMIKTIYGVGYVLRERPTPKVKTLSLVHKKAS